MNLWGHLQRSVGVALMVAFGNCGAFVATFTFLARDAPGYKMGYAVLLGSLALEAVVQVGYAGIVLRGNKEKRSRVEEDPDCGTSTSEDKRTWRAML